MNSSAAETRIVSSSWDEPAGCLMTGSGSAVFAVCHSPDDAVRVAAAARAAEPQSRVLVVRTLPIESA